jgi:outer membrane protein OmpA-like peptidoglycan-associated protein/opacity protein-like surface antigen
MRTYRLAAGRPGWAPDVLVALVLLLGWTTTGGAQDRRYLVEVGAAGAYQSFDKVTDLGGAAGGIGRLGVWLPLHFSFELEGAFASPKTQTANVGVGVKTFAASALYNFLVGSSSSIYLRLGAGSTKYGSDCPTSTSTRIICGSSGALLAGAGVRAAINPLLMVRGEGVFNHNRSKGVGSGDPVSISNFGINVGLSYMLGSKPVPDSDHDGVLNNRDRCPDTPAGAQVDARGCPADSDADGVPNGVDKCPNTPAGATVDINGCPSDSDGDNIPDGIDRCPDTPAGVLVDPRGCPKDSDEDGIPDGLDRCSDTPRGATVDALGCPGDEDGDGVLDGLDRCPRTPAGATVNAQGCVPGQQPGKPTPSALPQGQPPPSPPDTAAARPRPPAPQPQPRAQAQPQARAPAGGAITPGILPGVGFDPGTARLRPDAYIALDSIATILLANPSLRVEIGAHTDNAGRPADDLHLTTLQAEAVRDYLVVKSVPYQQVVARGYGSSVPLTPDNTPRGRAANRRVEIRPVLPGP